jgi:hypothetical protein
VLLWYDAVLSATDALNAPTVVHRILFTQEHIKQGELTGAIGLPSNTEYIE